MVLGYATGVDYHGAPLMISPGERKRFAGNTKLGQI
ncbi:hypothetical protein SLEP1_g2557 [Rubroshorea leprosula]|uniref:Uncharacterized protein n=1 Tax=Rubroshorea leprosula TaxID=152421 RepID=A0AAV5HRQ6_9ROSI|nr:hypothetical protein SLEP1_g2557 [Rubroshorea leprosula]